MLREFKNTPRRGRIYKHLQVLEHNDLENAIKSFPHLYNNFIKVKKKYIDKAMKAIYGRPIYFKENQTHDMVLSINDMCEMAGCSTAEMAGAINNHLNRRVCFFRNNGEARIPVELERIKQAYFSVKEGRPVEEIDKILYSE